MCSVFCATGTRNEDKYGNHLRKPNKITSPGVLLIGDRETTTCSVSGFNSILHIVYKMYKKLTRKYSKSVVVCREGEG